MLDVQSFWLFLDASGVSPRLGLWREGRWLAWSASDAPALEALYADIRALLNQAQLPWEQLGGYIYVEGPGSVLGLRVAAMAIRAWQTDDAARRGGKARPTWACGSLQLAASLAIAGGTPPPFAIFTEARQGHWHLLEVASATVGQANAGSAREVGENDLPHGPLFHLPARKAWHKAPPHARTIPTSLHDHPEILNLPNLLHPVTIPTPFTGQPHEYKKWTGAI